MPQFILDTSGTVAAVTGNQKIHVDAEWSDLDAFTQGYIKALFFTEEESLRFPDTGHGLGGRMNGGGIGFADLAPETLARIIADCAAFQDAAFSLIAQKIGFADLETNDGEPYTKARAGHDFWLTRNGHGAGFWDRGLPHGLGDALSALCGRGTEWPGRDAYIGDDGKVYLA